MTIYYQDETVRLIHGKFEDHIGDLRGDLIVADPPYGETSLDWDTWPNGWPSIAARHADSMWCFGSMRMFLDRRDEFTDWKLSQDVVWEKHAGTGFAADRFKRIHEHALHWYRGQWADIHHETPTEAASGPIKGRTINRGPTAHYGKQGQVGWVDEGRRIIRSVMRHRNMHGRAINETEKPVPLLEPLIAYACPPGGLVIDLFAGSCSAAVAVRHLGEGRRYVGFERREEQCEAAARRLSQGVLNFDEMGA